VTDARSLGSAHRGVAGFLAQRISSLYLAVFAIYFVVYLLLHPIKDYAAWSAYFSSGAVRLAWGIFFASLFVHVWLGLRSIYMDYLHATWLRFSVSLVTAFILIALAFWTAQILLRGAV
jgi:succinate dehydrogenase / fumarate reductase, membrane anchor subunit